MKQQHSLFYFVAEGGQSLVTALRYFSQPKRKTCQLKVKTVKLIQFGVKKTLIQLYNFNFVLKILSGRKTFLCPMVLLWSFQTQNQIGRRQNNRRKSNFTVLCMGNPHRQEITKTVRQPEAYLSQGEGQEPEDTKGRKAISKKGKGDI